MDWAAPWARAPIRPARASEESGDAPEARESGQPLTGMFPRGHGINAGGGTAGTIQAGSAARGQAAPSGECPEAPPVAVEPARERRKQRFSPPAAMRGGLSISPTPERKPCGSCAARRREPAPCERVNHSGDGLVGPAKTNILGSMASRLRTRNGDSDNVSMATAGPCDGGAAIPDQYSSICCSVGSLGSNW